MRYYDKDPANERENTEKPECSNIAKNTKQRVSRERKHKHPEPDVEYSQASCLLFRNLTNVDPGVCTKSNCIYEKNNHHADNSAIVHVKFYEEPDQEQERSHSKHSDYKDSLQSCTLPNKGRKEASNYLSCHQKDISNTRRDSATSGFLLDVFKDCLGVDIDWVDSCDLIQECKQADHISAVSIVRVT